MTNFDRFTTDTWTVAFPSDWEDQSEGDTTYFESPDGTKGLYLALWHLGEEESRSPTQLVDVFLAAELKDLLGGADGRELLLRQIEQSGDSVFCTWDTLARQNAYRVAGKIQARGKYVLRATFHDYDCEEYDSSLKYFEPIIASLALVEA